MYQAVCHYGTPAWSDEERAFAAAIRATLSANDINNSLNNIAGTSGEEGKTFARRHRDTLLIDEVVRRPRITSSPDPPTSAMLAGKRRWPSASAQLRGGYPAAQLAAGEPGQNLHCPWDVAGGESPRGDRHPFIQRQRPAGGQPARAQAGTGPNAPIVARSRRR